MSSLVQRAIDKVNSIQKFNEIGIVMVVLASLFLFISYAVIAVEENKPQEQKKKGLRIF